MNETLEVLMKRKSVRVFEPKTHRSPRKTSHSRCGHARLLLLEIPCSIPFWMLQTRI